MLSIGNYFYNSIVKGKKKERFEIILEPLQAVLQLALLASTPHDTKINISNNILYIQIPSWRQSITRTYNNDSKSDLFFLFNAIKRFCKFYTYLINISDEENNLFDLLREKAIKGLDKLLQTYKQTDNPALLHTLQIYKTLLKNEDNLNNIQEDSYGYDQSNEYGENTHLTTAGGNGNINNGNNKNNDFGGEVNDINNIFKGITDLYTNHDLIIIFNTLLLAEKNPNHYLEYINGLNEILEPINLQIKKWIVENVLY
jgi:hypothetical protein